MDVGDDAEMFTPKDCRTENPYQQRGVIVAAVTSCLKTWAAFHLSTSQDFPDRRQRNRPKPGAGVERIGWWGTGSANVSLLRSPPKSHEQSKVHSSQSGQFERPAYSR
jgi:hypothetical protein